MGEPTIDEVRTSLAHAAREGEVFPSVIRLLAKANGWTGRLRDVLEVLAEDQETMCFVAGGDRPDEVADCAERWARTALTTDQIRLVLQAGGYDPEPFALLADAGLLEACLRDESGMIRHVQGERIGTWLSDTLALASPAESIDVARRVIAETVPTRPS